MSTILKALDRVETRKEPELERDPLLDDVPLATHARHPETIPASMRGSREQGTRAWVWALVVLAFWAVAWGGLRAYWGWDAPESATIAESQPAPAEPERPAVSSAPNPERPAVSAAPNLREPAIAPDVAPGTPDTVESFALPPLPSAEANAPEPPLPSAEANAPEPPLGEPVAVETPPPTAWTTASEPPREEPAQVAAVPAHQVVPDPARAPVGKPPAVSAPPPPRPAPVETPVVIPPPPDIAVLKTAWHPDATRRSARIEVEGFPESVELREGDAVGTLVVVSIEPSAVVFLHGGEELRRQVGAR